MSGMDNVGFDVSLPAAGDLSAAQYKAVVLTQDGLEVVSTDGPVTGFLQDAPGAANRPGRVRVAGVAFAKAGGSFAQGAYLEVDADGDVVTAGAIATAVAQALEASQGNGAKVKVLVFGRPGALAKVTV